MKKRKRLKKVPIIFLTALIVGAGAFTYYNMQEKEPVNKPKQNNVIESEDKEIVEILKKYNLDYKVPKKYEKLFKKYSEVVENNVDITKYKKTVYNFFQVLMKDNINSYLDEDYFLEKLTHLNININEAITNQGANGYYYDNLHLIEIDEDNYVPLYHELMHLLDYSINSDRGESIWFCDDKYYTDTEYEKLTDTGDCKFIAPLPTEFIKEAGAEIYSTKYFKKGVNAYFDISMYFTAMEYILGSSTMDELFLSDNSDNDFLKLVLDNGFTLEKYYEVVQDLNYYTYSDRYEDYTPSGRIVDFLIDLYKYNKKGKDWKEDETFKYFLKNFMDMGYDAKYVNSKYKSDLDKIAYKSYDDYLKTQKDMLDQIPDNIEFNTTPIPVYIVDDEVYFGGKILNTSNKFAYFKYDFNKKKLSDFKYNTVE